MYNDHIFLTTKEILEKDFKLVVNGYSPQEVDKYLDMIIDDITEYNNNEKKLGREVHDLREENNELKREIRELNERLELYKSSENNTKTLTNLDLLKRISQLEKVVFGKEE